MQGWTTEIVFQVVAAFELFRGRSTQLIANNETVYGVDATQYLLDIKVHPNVTAEDVQVTLEGEQQQVAYSSFETLWRAALWWVNTDVQKVDVQIKLAGITEPAEQTIYLTVYQEPEGSYTDIIEGHSYEPGVDVNWRLGNSDPTKELSHVETGIYNLDQDRWHTWRRFEGDLYEHSVGINFNSGPLPDRDRYSQRTLFVYINPDSEEVYDTLFVIPELDQVPHDAYLFLYQTEIFEDDASITASIYTDHSELHDLTRQWITVNGGEHDLTLDVRGSRSAILKAAQYGFDQVGTYQIQLHTEFINTVPTTSSSEIRTLVVNPIPAVELLQDAYDDSSNNNHWQAIIDSPVATARQKEIAQEITSLNDRINAGEFDNFWPDADGRALVNQERDIYISETRNINPPLTFSEWREQQLDYNNAVEQQQYRNFVALAPTSSIGALQAYLDNTVLAHDSISDVLRDRDQIFVRRNYQDGVPADVILADYRNYQTWLVSQSAIRSFEDYIFIVFG